MLPLKNYLDLKEFISKKGESRELFFAPRDLKILSVVEANGRRYIKPAQFKVIIGELAMEFELIGPIIEIPTTLISEKYD